ncbi:MAG: hypothetical protein AB9866_28590 [Syntrophobacteraceae bacterium]
MKWRKLGLLFTPGGQYPWMLSHAQLPLALKIDKDLLRIFFASRDKKNRSHICYVDIDVRKPHSIVNLSPSPVLAPGPLGHFDDHGVYPASIVENGKELWMYYIGWNPGLQPPMFYSSIGLSVSVDKGNSFHRMSVAPIMSRSEFDPCLVTSPCVRLEHSLWRMWYVSGFKWTQEGSALSSHYHVKYAESRDGISWLRKGQVMIDLRRDETNIARPCVLFEDGLYTMWYSYDAGLGYRIGFAESPDGITWDRKDEHAGIEISSAGWDSKANAYPWVFSFEGRKYMLYNGNDYGRDGFGMAVEEQ